MRELERKESKRTALRLHPSVSTNNRVRRYFAGLRIADHRSGAVIDLGLLLRVR